ncbi:MAG TPA: pre-mycofactocin synthase MftD, partial [Pseudonocardiaceae bacterium]|nr:pre-mycofactocin synthase MftD [Pseudonocardiaceae bacterium]
DNVAAFDELGFAPRIAGRPGRRDLSTTVFGTRLAFPVLISPTGVQAVHPDGEVAVAKAAAARGIAMSLSCFASKPIEDVVAAQPTTFYQVHWIGGRDHLAHWLDRARAAGAAGLIATLDWSFAGGRDWGSPFIPERIDATAVRRYARQALTHPRWLARFLAAGRIPDLTVPNLAVPGEPAPTFFGAYARWQRTSPPTWDDVAWLREQWAGPLLLKGIIRVDDAKRAVDVGVTAISVSNHGGNNLDGTPATIRCLPAVADAVGDNVEVLLDGGIRRGSDVVKALALGARAVLIGRACLWGLAAGGEAGVAAVLDVLRRGVDSTLLALGRANVRQLSRDDIVVPPDFERALYSDTRCQKDRWEW